MYNVLLKARCKSDAERVEWRRLFPCSMRYTAYQRPRYLNGLCARFHRKKDIYDPMIYSRATRPLYYCAETSFSQNFKDLVQLLSLTIGERVEFVYTYFIMLETMCLAGEGEILDKAGAFEDIIIPAESNRSLFREYGPDQNSITIKLVDNKTSMANWKYHLVKISDRSVRVSRRNDDTSESDTSDASTPDSFSSNCEDSGTFDGENLFKKINASCSKFPDSRHKRQSFYHSLSSWALDFNIAFALTIPKFW
ncbi:hypothetical protein AB6A40_003717 [Gnathostoma spinigerum]|uniref:Uncharacterized protein n=1 Tax=Gnathostoma spinigerum TaxID=75299 RepID=A0ABD6EJ55_9BILA